MSNRKSKLFCFSYAGGTSSFYDQLELYLKSCVEVIKLEYSGHGTRRKEPFYSDFRELADDLYPIIRGEYCKNQSYGIFGYSMGSLSVIEILRKIIIEKEIALPDHIFIAAHEPSAKHIPIHTYTEKSDEYIKKRTIQFGGIPKDLIDNNSFWRVYLPVYRADYNMIAKYDFNDFDFKSNLSTTVFYSEEDTPFSGMKEWKNLFIGACEFIRYNGGHFFINDHMQEIANVIMKRLEGTKYEF